MRVTITRRCPRCKTTKPTEEFYVDRTRKDSTTSYCKVCHNAYQRERYQTLPGAPRRHRRNWMRGAIEQHYAAQRAAQ